LKAFTIIILLAIAVLADAVTGMAATVSTSTAIAGCNNPSSLEQCGSGSCQPTASPVISCSVTVTFSPAFISIPKFASAEYTGCNPSCHTETSPSPQGSVIFQSDNGEIWPNMPLAKTEIYGNTNHESIFFTTLSSNTAVFSANCLVGSASATAVLRPEYSLDGGSTWIELAQNTGSLDLNIGNSICGFVPGPEIVGPVGISSGAIGATIQLRIVGLNGNGVGDNITLNNIQLTFEGIIGQMYLICIGGLIFNNNIGCDGDAPISKTQMIVRITRMAPQISGSATSVSFNWIVSE